MPPSLTNIVDLAAGDGFAVGLRQNGTLVAWGTNSMGITNIPAGLSNIVAVSAAARNVLALQQDGSVYNWGRSIPLRRITTNAVAISAGTINHFILLADGSVLSYPDRFFLPLGGLSNILGVAAGANHGLAITADRKVIAWGENNRGQISVPAGLSNVMQVAAGATFSAALTREGRLVTWGTNTAAPMLTLAESERFKWVSAGATHLLALREDGSVFGWGSNAAGQTNIPPGMSNAVLVAAGDNVSVAITGDAPPHIRTSLVSKTLLLSTRQEILPEIIGALPVSFQWMFNGQPIPTATNRSLVLESVRLSDAGAYSLSVSNAFGQNQSATFDIAPTQIKFLGTAHGLTNIPPGMTNIVKVVGGDTHALALRRDGTIVTWGWNAPVPPQGLTNVTYIAAGARNSAAVLNSGDVVVWGPIMQNQPNVFADIHDAAAVAPGLFGVVVLRTNGSLWSWAPPNDQSNLDERFMALPDVDNVVDIAARVRAVALRADGTVVDWPADLATGGSANSKSITNAVAIFGAQGVSVEHATVLLSDGSVFSWGSPGYRATNEPLPYIERGALTETTDLLLLRDGTLRVATMRSFTPPQIPSDIPAPSDVFATDGAFGILLGTGSPFITTPLLDRRIAAGSDLAIKAWATGALPLSYQWRFQGQPIPSATNSTLLIPSAQIVNSGRYQLVVSNSFGATEADLQVAVEPVVVKTEPVSATNLFGSTATFTVEALGRNLQYQWRRNGVDLPGQTNATLKITNVGHAEAGLYGLLISNELGSVTTQARPLFLQSVAYWGMPVAANLLPFMLATTNVLGVVAGDGGALVIDRSNTLQPIGESGVIAASAAHFMTLMLKTNGTVAVYGSNPAGPTEPPADLTNAVAVAAGYYHGMALRDDGTVVAWGDERYGVTNVPVGLSNVVAIAAGHELSLALTRDGQVVQWGDTNALYAPPLDLTNVIGISAALTAGIAVRQDGTVATWGFWDTANFSGPVSNPLENLTNVIRAVSGGLHYLALTAEGKVFAWGYNNYGQTNVPPELVNAQDIAAGYYHSMALVDAFPPMQRAQLEVASLGSTPEVRIRIASSVNRVYALEYSTNLATPRWDSRPLKAGTGRALEFTEPVADGHAKFFRVRRW